MTALNVDEAQAHTDTHAAYGDLCVLKGTQAYEAARKWVESLAAQQQAVMTSCARDKLPDAQVRLRMLAAMLAALEHPGEGGTGHVFD